MGKHRIFIATVVAYSAMLKKQNKQPMVFKNKPQAQAKPAVATKQKKSRYQINL